MKLIVGLGNPGKKYARTRHNVGFMALDFLRTRLAEKYTVSDWELSKKFNAEMCGTTIGSQKIILLKPMTFMNASGQSVQLAAAFYKLMPKDIVVVHDDKDLPLGEIRCQFDRGAAGHNGVHSIAEQLSTKAFERVRIGIASEDQKRMADMSAFVLSNFALFERSKIKKLLQQAAEEILKKI